MMRRLTVAFLSLLFGLISCSEPYQEYGVERASTLFLSSSQPLTLDPAKSYSPAGSEIGAIFSGLVRLDTNLQVQPDLALGWDVSDDEMVYTFFLHPNARFHDGRAVTAQDVAFSWSRALAPETESDTAASYLDDIAGSAEFHRGQASAISGIKVIDDRTLQVTLYAPAPYFLGKLTLPATFVVDQNNVAEQNWDHHPNGSGAFRLQTWEDDKVLILQRNDDYYREPAQIRHVIYDLGAGLGLSLYEENKIDMVWIGGDSLERTRDPNDPLSADLRSHPSLCTNFIGINNHRPPMDDPRVRQAFSLAIDRDRLISGLYSGDALSADGILPPAMPGYIGLDSEQYDPARARKLLREANITLPLTLTYTTSGYGDVGGLPLAAITMWEEALDVSIVPEQVEPYRYNEKLYSGKIGDFFSAGWCADYPDPSNFLDTLFHSQSLQNLGGYSNPTIDQLLEEARIEPDSQKRMALYHAIEKQLNVDTPLITISHDFDHLLVHQRVQGFVFTPIDIPQWDKITLK